ncbi:MAG TPA: ATP/GTP-binding protein [Ilumatobacteraceae bacterium]|nr:ATP/GTP-binding protein [Ilumatobacteraceae bacterium]
MTASLQVLMHASDDLDESVRPYRPAGGAGTDHVFKILVTGPFAAGKTSLIQSVSQTPVVSTDVATSGDESVVKALTTVALDFGTYHIDGDGDGTGADDGVDGVQLLLFGTPGQERFWFMTDVLKGEVDVVTFVVDAEAEHTHAEAGAAMRALLKDLRVPLVVAVNRCDDADVATMLARSLGALACEPVVACQLIDPESGRDVVIEALLTLLESMEGPPSGWHAEAAQMVGAW